jgi:hypothetical protein
MLPTNNEEFRGRSRCSGAWGCNRDRREGNKVQSHLWAVVIRQNQSQYTYRNISNRI